MKEIFTPLYGYENLYLVSNYGRVKSLRKSNKVKNNDNFLRPSRHTHGYKRYKLTDENGASKCKYVHRIVYESFKGPLMSGYEIDHIDSDKSNNRLDNLQAISHQKNVMKSINKGHVTTEDLRQALYKELGDIYEIAVKYNLLPITVQKILKQRSNVC